MLKDIEDLVPEGVSKILNNIEENLHFLENLAECSVIIYNITEDSDQVIEASRVLNGNFFLSTCKMYYHDKPIFFYRLNLQR